MQRTTSQQAHAPPERLENVFVPLGLPATFCNSLLGSVTSVPVAENPIPPAYETVNASGARVFSLTGPLAMNGLWTHGYAVSDE